MDVCPLKGLHPGHEPGNQATKEPELGVGDVNAVVREVSMIVERNSECQTEVGAHESRHAAPQHPQAGGIKRRHGHVHSVVIDYDVKVQIE